MSSSATFSSDHHNHNHNHHHLPPPSEQLCYVQCSFCDTVLAVSVPCSSLFATVTVRCGHCTNLLSVNMRAHLLPAAANQLHLDHNFFSHPNIMEERKNNSFNLLMNNQSIPELFGPLRVDELLVKPPVVNRPPEKRQRVPSAYNRFIKEEIQRIKAGNPDISHRESFSAAAKNWAHFPYSHFGLMPDQPLKKPNVCLQEGDDLRLKDALLTTGNMGVSPY